MSIHLFRFCILPFAFRNIRTYFHVVKNGTNAFALAPSLTLHQLQNHFHSRVALTGTDLDNPGITAVAVCILGSVFVKKLRNQIKDVLDYTNGLFSIDGDRCK